MAAGTTPIFLASVKTAGVTFVNADGTTPKAVVTIGANGGRVVGLAAATDDTAPIDYAVYVQRAGAGTNFLLGTVSVPAGAGFSSGTASVNLLDPAKIRLLDVQGAPFTDTLPLGATDVLKVAPLTAVTAAKTTYITGIYGDY